MARTRTVGDLVDRVMQQPMKIKSAADRDRYLKWWKGHYEKRTLWAMTSAVVAAARDRLAAQNIGSAEHPRQRAPQAVRHYLIALQAAMTLARRELRWIERNPVSDVRVPPVAPARMRWLSPEARGALRDACANSDNPDLALVVELALTSGARLGEITSLKWSMIDGGESCAILPTSKTASNASLPSWATSP